MKCFLIIFLFFIISTSKVNAGTSVIITKIIKEPFEQLLNLFQKTPNSIDEIPGNTINKIFPENSSDEIIIDDFSKTIFYESDDTAISVETKKTESISNDSKSKIIVPATGGFVYSKNKNEEKKIKEESKKNISKK